MKKFVSLLLLAGLVSLGVTTSIAAETAPKSVIHVVTVAWKEGTTDAQIKAALDGAQALTKSYKGITRVWTRTLKAQGGKSHAIVMEFASEKALADYTDSEAQKEWYKAYIPIRGESTTFDITN